MPALTWTMTQTSQSRWARFFIQNTVPGYLWRRWKRHRYWSVALPRSTEFDLEGVRISADGLSSMMRHAVCEGSYEWIERRLACQFLGAADRVVELGAAIGAVGLTSQKRLGISTWYSVEANPRTFAMLQRNYQLNGRPFHGMHAAVTATPGSTVRLNLNPDLWVDSLVTPATLEAVEIPAIRLPELIARLSFEPTALVIDIEGAEYDIDPVTIPGSVRVVIMELHPDLASLTTHFGFVARLMAAGFKPEVQLGMTVAFRR